VIDLGTAIRCPPDLSPVMDETSARRQQARLDTGDGLMAGAEPDVTMAVRTGALLGGAVGVPSSSPGAARKTLPGNGRCPTCRRRAGALPAGGGLKEDNDISTLGISTRFDVERDFTWPATRSRTARDHVCVRYYEQPSQRIRRARDPFASAT
jgi:hypothetical protein